MQYKLIKPLQGEEEITKIDIKFNGIEGLRSLKKLESIVLKAVSQKNDRSKDGKSSSKGDVADITADKLYLALEFMGYGLEYFNQSWDLIVEFARHNGNPLINTHLAQLSHEDIEGLVFAIFEEFIAKKLILKLKNLGG